VTVVALVLAAAALQGNAAGPSAGSAERQERFTQLLRTYPQRPPRETVAQVERLVETGEFPDRDRAEYWAGTVLLSLHDSDGARRWYLRLQHDYADSPWVERGWVGLGDAAVQERRYRTALDWYGKARSARDPSVREMGRIATHSAEMLRARQVCAWAAGAFAAGVAVLLVVSLVRHGPVTLWPLPTEARVVLPVLAVLALLSIRQDPAPRAAILELCAGAAILVILSGMRLRAVHPRLPARAVHAVGTLAALFALAYVAVYRGGLIGMLVETFRAGPE
jgi:hypothetical protein